MIDVYRRKIDRLDERIAEALEDRQRLVEMIQHEKNQQKLPAKDRQREREVLRRVQKRAPHFAFIACTKLYTWLFDSCG
jgi:chorismate mutase